MWQSAARVAPAAVAEAVRALSVARVCGTSATEGPAAVRYRGEAEVRYVRYIRYVRYVRDIRYVSYVRYRG